MMTNYSLSNAAQSDLQRIYIYGYERFGEALADKYYNDLFDCFENIAAEPLMFPANDDLRPGYRRCVCGVDTIYYRINSGEIEIVRILGRQSRNKLL